MTQPPRCVAKDRFMRAKGENVVVKHLMTRKKRAVVMISISMVVPVSIAVVRWFYDAMVIRDAVGIILTIKTRSSVVMVVFVIKITKRTLVVVPKATTLIQASVVKEINIPMMMETRSAVRI